MARLLATHRSPCHAPARPAPLPGSGRALRAAPVFHHYLDDPEQVPAAILRADLHLPLAP